MDLDLIKLHYKNWKDNILPDALKVEKYYRIMDTDSNVKPSVGGIKKVALGLIPTLIDEEAHYSINNVITYVSDLDNKNLVKVINNNIKHLSNKVDTNLMKELIKSKKVFELSYLDNLKFKTKVISPREGFIIADEFDNILYFVRVYKKNFAKEETITVYDNTNVYTLDKDFVLVKKGLHGFSSIPVSYAELEGNSIYDFCKTLQDALETVLSNGVNEFSDFRNAIMMFFGDMTDTDIEVENEDGSITIEHRKPVTNNDSVLEFEDMKNQGAKWLTKELPSEFFSLLVKFIKEFIYDNLGHIDTSGNVNYASGIALRARLNRLENRCKDNEKALQDLLKNRIKLMLEIVNKRERADYDYLDIKAKFTPSIPTDLAVNTDAAVKLVGAGIASKETVRANLFGFINNIEIEADKIRKEKLEEIEMFGGAEEDEEI